MSRAIAATGEQELEPKSVPSPRWQTFQAGSSADSASKSSPPRQIQKRGSPQACAVTR
jgi:hypothetical protein